MTLCTRHEAAWLMVTTLLVTGPVATAQSGFRMLNEKEIRARVVGKDITDGSDWSMYLRPDGALITSEAGSSRIGRWKIGNNKLCTAHESGASLTCNEVWMSGVLIRMRENKDQETFDAIVKEHQKN